MAKIGFIGLGTMGNPMSRHLIAGGHEVRGFDVDAAAVQRIVDAGGKAAETPAAAADGADFIITMLPNAPHVRAALFGENGAAPAIGKDALYIDMSTIHPLESDAIAAELDGLGVRMIDVPVGRTSAHAEQGTLLIMAGGEADDVERARPLFELLGDTIVHCGPRGSGARMKVVNNFMSSALSVLTAEALSLAEAVGLDIETTVGVLTSTPAGMGHLSTTYPVGVLAGNLEPGFMIDLAHKDLGLGLDLAAAMNLPVPVAAAAREAFSLARSQGYGRKDWSAMFEFSRDLRSRKKAA